MIAQINPTIGLLSAIGIISLFIWIFWPKKGGYALFQKNSRNLQRELLEDALKFLFDREYKKKEVDAQLLKNHLDISNTEMENIIKKMSELNLLQQKNNALTLTDAGREYALKVIRIHRIWERYLADETNTAPIDWHEEACRMEHLLSEEEADHLASQIGHPVFDPHGDPIPTTDGKLPASNTVTLAQLKKGDTANITHIEDEPVEIYEQLLALDLHPGMQIYITDVNEKRITFVAHSDQCSLTPLFANAIEVEKIVDKPSEIINGIPLSQLEMDQEGEILEISPNCRGLQRRRLMDLGVIPGSKIKPIMENASGNPRGYRVMGTTIGLRKQQSDQIFIKQ